MLSIEVSKRAWVNRVVEVLATVAADWRTLRRCIAGAEILGGRAVLVRTIDAEAVRYWESWGFVASRDNPSS